MFAALGELWRGRGGITKVEFIFKGEEEESELGTHPVLFVASECAVQILERDVVVLVQPLHDERLEPGWVLGHSALVGRYLLHVVRVQPFNLFWVRVGKFSIKSYDFFRNWKDKRSPKRRACHTLKCRFM